MKNKVSVLWLLLLVCAVIAGSQSAQARDKYDRRDPIRSARTGARELLTLAQGSVRLDVKPKDAEVFVDDRYQGIVRDFNDKDHPLFLFPGRHWIEIRHPKHETYRVPVELRPGQDMRIKVKLRKY